MRTLAILVVLAGTAAAEPNPPAPDRVLGLVFGYGTLPVDGRELSTESSGVDAERRIHGRWRGFAHYEYLWLGERDDERARQDVIDGAGHRAHAGLRATLGQHRWTSLPLRVYLDAEVGGGLTVASEPMASHVLEPHAFVGLRAGYDFLFAQRHARSSTAWEPELVLRAIAVERGVGWMFAVGLGWGD